MSRELVFICGGGALLLVPSIGLAIWSVINTWRSHKAHVRLAEEGGYQILHDVPHVISRVYGGEKDGRPFAFQVSPKFSRSTNSDGRSSVSVRYQLQLILPLTHTNLAGLSLTPISGLRTIPNCFEKIWIAKPEFNQLTYHQQKALMEFATGNPHPAGNYSGSVRMRPFVRSVTLLEREAAAHNLTAEIFPDAASLLIYEHPKADIQLEEFESLAAELAALAQSLESARTKCMAPRKRVNVDALLVAA